MNDHPVPSCYGSLCILWLWITLYPSSGRGRGGVNPNVVIHLIFVLHLLSLRSLRKSLAVGWGVGGVGVSELDNNANLWLLLAS